jgi:type II secretory pathway component PulC
MKINFILVKKALIIMLGAVAMYYLINLYLVLMSQPEDIKNNFSSISNSQSILENPRQSLQETVSSSFNYKVIGYRAGDKRASVIVEKNNQTYVVQQGELLENTYKLESVNSKIAIFTQNGKSYQLSTDIIINN